MTVPDPQQPTPSELFTRLISDFPELAGSSYRYNEDGWDHQVLILNEALVFRFPRDEEYLGLLKNEIRLLDDLQSRVSIRIPHYTYFAPDLRYAGYVMVKGDALKFDYFKTLSPGDRTIIAKQLAGFLSTIHTLIEQGYDASYIPPTSMQADQQEMKELVAKHLEFTLESADLRIIHQLIKDVDQILENKLPSVFIHNDIYNSHMLWDETAKQFGLIDFSDMSIGDPAFDFAELYEYGEDFVQEVYNHYKGPKDDTMLKRAWVYQGWVGVYMMIDHFINYKTSFEVARQTFDRWKKGPYR